MNKNLLLVLSLISLSFIHPQDSDKIATIKDLKQKVRKFNQERDWEQFQTPKNMAMAIGAEAGELLDIFRWIESKESLDLYKQKKQAVEDEIADLFWTLLCFCNSAEIDLTQALKSKMDRSAQKYPIEKCSGKIEKYTEYKVKINGK